MKKTRTNKNAVGTERGQSLVELSSMLLVILILVAGAVDLGMGFFSFVAVRDAAQEGALYGSLYPTDTSGITNRVRGESSAPVDLSDVSKVTVSISTTAGACRGGGVTVTVSYNYPISMPLLSTILGRTTIPLNASVTDTIINPKCP
jgi:Flp pilus assembly protein TadG